MLCHTLGKSYNEGKNQLTLDGFLIREKRKATAEKEDSAELKRQRREKTLEGQLPSNFMKGDSSSKQ